MSSNIVIFADGTGQRGGVLFDERRSNIYKLFRATRCGPDSIVDAKVQRAFYDPGIGTSPPGMGFLTTLWNTIYNIVSQALGIGLTKNVIDCYAALIRLWRPGDKIFLFGFSRGAYTARCLGAVVSFCGIPQQAADGSSLKRDYTTSSDIAHEAVKTVYQHTSSWNYERATARQQELLNQRTLLASRFRKKYRSGNDDGPNVFPHFIGVFDTVASLSNPVAAAIFSLAGLALVGVVGIVIWFLFATDRSLIALLKVSGSLVVLTLAAGFAVSLFMRIKSEIGLPRQKRWRVFHLAESRMKFYDNQLNPNVGYARHAISIDETRESFERVRWGTPKVWRDTGLHEDGKHNPRWFEQLWFAGNHSDIGGSYPEDESRLSDISLEWMLKTACRVGLLVDPNLLRLYPDPSGPQHDETKSSWIFRISGKSPRELKSDFPLHPSVVQRFAAGEVLHYDLMTDYRPSNLRGHNDVKHYYELAKKEDDQSPPE